MPLSVGVPPSIATENLILLLTRNLRPVRRLARPMIRALAWLGGVSMLAVLVASSGNLVAVARLLATVPDMWLSVVGSVLTLVTAAVAAFEISLPDRSRLWCALPAAPAALWLGASGLGCLRAALDIVAPFRRATTADALGECMPFILGMSLPLAISIGWMLRRARPHRPGAVSVLAGLASASGSASLLWLVHPFDTSAIDVAVHLATVLVVIAGARTTARFGYSRLQTSEMLA